MKKTSIIQFIAVLLISLSVPAYGKEHIPAQLVTAITLKALNYDRSLDERVQDRLVIGILYSHNDKNQKQYADKIYKSITKIQSNFTIRKFPIKAELIGVTGEQVAQNESLPTLFREKNVNALLIITKDTHIVDAAIHTTRVLKINSICMNKQSLTRGVGIALIEQNNKPKLWVNIEAIKEEGSAYSGKFLGICTKFR